MPGEYTDTQLSEIAKITQTFRAKADQGKAKDKDKEKIKSGGPQGLKAAPANCTLLTERDLQALARAVDFSGCHSILDPFSGAGSISKFFKSSLGRQIRTYVGTHQAALQPAFYAQYPAQVIVTAPPAELLDLIVPLATVAASAVACVYVPGSWVSSPPEPRQRWLRTLRDSDRLVVLMGSHTEPMGTRGVWLLSFSTPQIKQAMLRPTAVVKMSK